MASLSNMQHEDMHMHASPNQDQSAESVMGRSNFRRKQRTFSMDPHRDYTYIETWWSIRDLIRRREWLVPVNSFSIWRRHLAWAMEHGGDLRNYMTSRFASNMVFLSLLLTAELNVLFSPSTITADIRTALQNQIHSELKFWIGITVLLSIIFTLFSLIITFTAWGMVSAISDENAHCILRSSIGQYIGELPHRFIIASIYTFLLWIIMFIFLLISVGPWSILLVVLILALFVHVMTAFSSFGRIVLHTAAMAPNPIFEESYEKSLTPQLLQEQLYIKAKAEILNNTSITRQYRRNPFLLSRRYNLEELLECLGNTAYEHQEEEEEGNEDYLRFTSFTRAATKVRFVNTFLSNQGPAMRKDSKTNQHHASQSFVPQNEANTFGNQGLIADQAQYGSVNESVVAHDFPPKDTSNG
jgi:hypothetical protein